MDENLTKLFEKINYIDTEVLELLNTRAMLTKKIDSLKNKTDQNYYNPPKEEEAIDRMDQSNEGSLTNENIKEILTDYLLML